MVFKYKKIWILDANRWYELTYFDTAQDQNKQWYSFNDIDQWSLANGSAWLSPITQEDLDRYGLTNGI